LKSITISLGRTKDCVGSSDGPDELSSFYFVFEATIARQSECNNVTFRVDGAGVCFTATVEKNACREMCVLQGADDNEANGIGDSGFAGEWGGLYGAGCGTGWAGAEPRDDDGEEPIDALLKKI
jgi:hypothetical protein